MLEPRSRPGCESCRVWLRWSGTIRRPCRLWAFCLNRPRGRGQHCPPLARVNQVSGVRERAGDGQPQRHVKLVNAERKLTPYCRAGTRGSFFTRRRQSSATRQRWPARPHTSGQAAPSPCLHARTPCAAQIRVTGAGTSRRAMEVRRVGFRVAQAPRSGMVPCDQDARGHVPGRSPPEVDLEATTVAAVVGDEGLHGTIPVVVAHAPEHHDGSAAGDAEQFGDVVARQSRLDGSPSPRDHDAGAFLEHAVQRLVAEVLVHQTGGDVEALSGRDSITTTDLRVIGNPGAGL